MISNQQSLCNLINLISFNTSSHLDDFKRVIFRFLSANIACMMLSFSLHAGSMGSTTLLPLKVNHPWSITASLGYTDYQNMYKGDGQTALGRLAIDYTIDHRLSTYGDGEVVFGIEAGVQNGNNMRLDIQQITLDELGGLPIQSIIKPQLDLLFTLKTANWDKIPLFALFKGGIAYRRWEFNDRNTVNDQSQIAGEAQAGLGYEISEHASLSLSYQGIFGGNPNFQADLVTGTAQVFNIPTQHGVLIGLSFNI